MELLAGWSWDGSTLQPTDTVAGAIARGEAFKARCTKGECRRYITMDLTKAAADGLGETPVRDLQQAWTCRVAAGCKLQWDSLYPGGVPLQFYVSSDAVISIRCQGCGYARRRQPLDLIETLRRRRLGDGNTSVRHVHQLVRGACPSCGARRWASDVVWPHRPGQGPAPIPPRD